MKLTIEEMQVMVSIIKDFSNLSDILEIESTKMDELEKQRADISNKLNQINDEILSVRAKEKEFTDQLVEKYGPFKFNPATLEIEKI